MQSQRKQSAVIALVRDNLSDKVVNRLRNMIVDGTLPAGERINEVHLSRDLGVSRTPLREALSRLVHEGAIRSVPRIGYFVRELTLQEFENIYAIRPILEPEALRLAGLPSRERLERLVSLNDRIGKAKHADAVIDGVHPADHKPHSPIRDRAHAGAPQHCSCHEEPSLDHDRASPSGSRRRVR
jgi:DNA-binding GntR family transcriptional regulator